MERHQVAPARAWGTVFSLSFTRQLTIVPSGTNVILTWPSNYTGYTLQSASAISATFTNVFGATSPYTNATTVSGVTRVFPTRITFCSSRRSGGDSGARAEASVTFIERLCTRMGQIKRGEPNRAAAIASESIGADRQHIYRVV